MTFLERLGRFEARHAKLVALGWVAAVVVSFGLALGAFGGASLFDRLTSGEPVVPGESRVGRDLLAAQHADGPAVVITLDGVDPASAQVRSTVQDLTQALSEVPDVSKVTSPYDVPGGPTGAAARTLLAADGHGLAVTARLASDLSRAQSTERTDAIERAVAEAAGQLPGVQARTTSVPQLVDEITHQVELDLRRGEGIALPISLLVMVLVFGGFLAAGLPLAGAIASIAGGLASLWVFSGVIDLDATVVNVVTILGLGLCIDYGLLVVSRFREELRAVPWPDGDPSREQVVDAVGRTVAIAGRTVLFSGLIVAISLSGLMLFQAQILRALGAAGVSVVVVALLVALTFVPALLSLSGRRLVHPGLLSRVPFLHRLLTRFGDVAPAEGVFSRLARRVQRHPWPIALGVTALLLLLAVPAFGLHLRSSGTELMPVGSTQRDGFDGIAARYPALAGPDIAVVARAPIADVQDWAKDVAAVPGVQAVDPPQQEGSVVSLGVRVDGHDPGGQTAADVVRRLRDDRPDFPIWVTGQAAGQVDFSASILRTAPYAIGLVVLATFVLLFLMTGSVLVPVKALVMNVISLGASLGVVTWVFEQGHLEGLLSFTSTGGIETTIPPLVLAFGFGLAMDYEVFLLSRIKEQHDLGLSNDESVAIGLQRSGRIITSAALLVFIVFAGLLAAEVLVVKQTGVALMVAVAIDATLVRMLLVPATMTLLGEWNWWAPGPLRRLHNRIGIGTH